MAAFLILYMLPYQIYLEGYLFNLGNIAVSRGQKSLFNLILPRN